MDLLTRIYSHSQKKLHIRRYRYQQSRPYRPLPGIVRYTLCGLLVVLLGYGFMQPTLVFADGPLVTQEIRYYMPEAGEVFLVWGIDGWQLVSETLRPSGT